MTVASDKFGQLARVGEVFTPSSPVDRYAIFAGRLDQIMEIVNAIQGKGQHVVLYGERGVGKTSLANVLTEVFGKMDRAPWKYARVNCTTGNGYGAIWSNVFRELGVEVDESVGRYTPETVRQLLGDGTSIIVIDELDRLENDDALTDIADTVKTLSDHASPATLILVGVADSVDELIGDHQSIERALVQVPMPRMKVDELEEIVEKGRIELDMKVTRSARSRIARLSEGLPHYTHLLALHAFGSAVMDDRDEVTDADVDRAIKQAVDKAQHSIKGAYQRATRSVRPDNLFGSVLLACALAPKDELGFFTAGSVRAPMQRIMGRRYEIQAFARHLSEFTDEERGPVLSCVGPVRKKFYRFQNPMLTPYVILSALGTRQITEDDIAGQAILPEGPDEPELPLNLLA